jgi:hypothetical protein
MSSYLEGRGYTLGETDVFINTLLDLIDGNIEVKGVGICGNWSWAIEGLLINSNRTGYRLVENLSVGWPDHTGDRCRPIPNHFSLPMWEDQQLEYRQSLMRYMLEQLTVYGSTL